MISKQRCNILLPLLLLVRKAVSLIFCLVLSQAQAEDNERALVNNYNLGFPWLAALQSVLHFHGLVFWSS